MQYGLHSSTMLPYIVQAQQDGFDVFIVPSLVSHLYFQERGEEFWEMVVHQVDPQELAVVTNDASILFYEVITDWN
jgi:hypothetical protein